MEQLFKSLFSLMALPLLILLTGCNSDSGSTEPTVKLESILIVASPITTRGVSELKLAKGNQQPFEATGSYSDGSSEVLTKKVEWHSSDEAIATVTSEGELSGVNAGPTTVTATLDDITSNLVDVTVTDAVMTAIEVIPLAVSMAKSQTHQFEAKAIYSDGTTSDVTKSVGWYSESEYIATVTSEGELSGVNAGPTTVTATLDDITSNLVDVTVTDAAITHIAVTPSSPNVVKGKIKNLTAMVFYDDTTYSNETRSVEWHSESEYIAAVTSEGELSGVNVGPTTVTATYDDITSNEVKVTVTDAVITNITVEPRPATVAQGQTLQLKAVATYSDGTTYSVTSDVSWHSNNSLIAIVTPEGELSGVNVGPTTVTATYDDITSNTVNVTVTDAVITDITVAPSPVNVVKGQTLQLKATATHSDMSHSDVTNSVNWRLGNKTTAEVTISGGLTGVNASSTTLTVVKGDIITTVDVNVCNLSDLGHSCLDIFDTGNGKLFTNSPSKAFLDSMNEDAYDEYPTASEDGTTGPSGQFYLFEWDNANALCTTYNSQNIGGRDNWRLATRDELEMELFGEYQDMFEHRYWPTGMSYWSETIYDVGYYNVYLSHGQVNAGRPDTPIYASCVSDL
ncbi:Ig-like domain-containing protein [uncultured Vibrio sp.]|uniref:Ig-like domain-containing protein n=1 Tax=uncultured Vibrio sp. TaxID=114054 RepID=UPI002623F431|nr:Ig-like domain-containing protein [uncultured Vibrio sp.]